MTTSLQQLRDDALTMLVLWAASREYSPDVEAVLNHWASTFEIPDAELQRRLLAAASGKLAKPGAKVAYELQQPQQQQQQPPAAQQQQPVAATVAVATTIGNPQLGSEQQTTD